MIRHFFSALLLSGVLSAAESGSALASLTYSGDQDSLAKLDQDLAAAGTDAAKLATVESRLFAVLRAGDSTFAARQAACQRLGRLLAGTAPKARAEDYRPLAAMLLDERDFDLARLALEPAPGAAVDGLFVSALAKSSGRIRLGLIDSLGRRRVAAVVPALAALLTGADAATSAASAHALGAIGTPSSAEALLKATALPPAVRATELLAASQRLPVEDAKRVVRTLKEDATVPSPLRAAAFRRSVDLDPSTALEAIVRVCAASDWEMKQVALEALTGLPPAEVARAFAQPLSRWDAPTQAAALAALAEGGDAAAVPTALAALAHPASEVRLAALAALGRLPGTPAVADRLAQATTAEASEEAKVARQSLARLNGPGVSAAILARAEKGEAATRAVFLEQLAARHMSEALPLLLRCRQETDTSVRTAAVGALGELAPFSEQAAVLAWASDATDETEQARALRALVSLTLRNRDVAARGRAIHAAIESAPPDVALRLLPALGRLGGTASADCAARLALRDDPRVADAAIAALGRWSDATVTPVLAHVAEKAARASVRQSAVEHAARFLERNREPWKAATTSLVARLLAATSSSSVRKPFLTLLARATDRSAVPLAEKFAGDAELAAEARYAVAAIQANLEGTPKVRASGGANPGNIVDGKATSRWSVPALGEEWVEVDLRRSRPLRRLTLDQGTRGNEYPERYAVHVTDDPKAPGPAVVTGSGQRNRTVITLPDGTAGRYLLIKNTAERKDTPWSISELYLD
ncbi:MAG: HEAT repeat domain-containing protein [Verrucomicrobia bacterium]|nr:HEAT repeat domain-containing protein [Verrucomicrobiota bacterium]